jgi:hypothetical protein
MTIYVIVSIAKDWSPESLRLGGTTSSGMSLEDIHQLFHVFVTY